AVRQYLGDAAELPVVRTRRGSGDPGGDQVPRRPLGPPPRRDHGAHRGALPHGQRRSRRFRRLRRSGPLLRNAAGTAHAGGAPPPPRALGARGGPLAGAAPRGRPGPPPGPAGDPRPRAVEAGFPGRLQPVWGAPAHGVHRRRRRDARRAPPLQDWRQLRGIREPHYSHIARREPDRPSLEGTGAAPAAARGARSGRGPDRGSGGRVRPPQRGLVTSFSNYPPIHSGGSSFGRYFGRTSYYLTALNNH